MLTYNDLYSKWAISFPLQHVTFASISKASNCNFYYPFPDSCQTEVLGQKVKTAVSTPQFSGPSCQGSSSPEWPVSAPSPALQLGNCGETEENCPIFRCRLKEEDVPQTGRQRRREERPVENQTLKLVSAKK